MVKLAALTRAYQHVRDELATVGLIEDLDHIECVRSVLPAGRWRTMGWVYDRGVFGPMALVGFREGVIYVPFDAPFGRARGQTLRDVLRHEYAHALAWSRPSFVRGRWFREAFGGGYDDDWEEQPEFDPALFVSAYATTSPKEDFAETLMVLLRGDAVRELPVGVRRKVQAVAGAVRARARR